MFCVKSHDQLKCWANGEQCWANGVFSFCSVQKDHETKQINIISTVLKVCAYVRGNVPSILQNHTHTNLWYYTFNIAYNIRFHWLYHIVLHVLDLYYSVYLLYCMYRYVRKLTRACCVVDRMPLDCVILIAWTQSRALPTFVLILSRSMSMSSITPLALDGFHNVICYCTLEVYDYINSVNNHFSKKVASGDSSELRETVLNSLRHYEVLNNFWLQAYKTFWNCLICMWVHVTWLNIYNIWIFCSVIS